MEVAPPIIFVSLENWDDVWRRNQFVCAELSRRWPGRMILFVGLPLDVSNALRTLKFGRLIRSETHAISGFPGIITTHPLKCLPSSFAIGRAVNDWMFRFHIKRAARHWGVKNPLLWINSHAAVHLVGRLAECAVIYDITDDWIALNQREGVRLRTIAQDADLCRRADAVIVCSKRLLELKRPLTRTSVHLIPNGVDVEHYRAGDDLNRQLPGEYAAWQRPVFGYTGTVHPDRVDVKLLATMARRLEGGSLVFVGPNHLPPETLSGLAQFKNLHFTGQVSYQVIPQYMRAFDVCIVPHLVSPFTESLNPIKLWEYLAAGKPIVSTPVAGFRDYPQFVKLAATADQFLVAMQEALAEDPRLADARRSEAAKHSWASRVDQIEGVIAQVIESRPGESVAANTR